MIQREIVRFLVVGVIVTLIDFCVYCALLWMGTNIYVAKTISFLTGTTCAYFGNRAWTFGHTEQKGFGSAPKYFAVYLMSMGANVLVNGLSFGWLTGAQIGGGTYIAFVLATGTSTVLNFIGIKLFVFKAPKLPEAS
jgi:putative flippase GtrA